MRRRRRARRHARRSLNLNLWSRVREAGQESERATTPATRSATTAAPPTRRAPSYRSDGTPTPANPNYSLATFGPAPIGVPNFFIDKFRIPPFLLPIYQAAGIQYGIRWEVLAAINEIETRLRPQPQRLLRRRAGLDAVHAPHVGDVRRRRQRRRPEGPVQPRRRDLRGRPLPARRRRRQGPLPRDLRLQPRRLVRGVRADAGARHRRPAGRPRRLAHGPDPGPLPRRRQGHLRRRAAQERAHKGVRAGQEPRPRDRVGRNAPLDPTSSAARARP